MERSDITLIHTNEGWLYLAGIKDLFDANLVGFSMSSRMTQDLVNFAIPGGSGQTPKIGPNPSFQPGSQHCGRSYAKLLKQFGMTPSMM